MRTWVYSLAALLAAVTLGVWLSSKGDRVQSVTTLSIGAADDEPIVPRIRVRRLDRIPRLLGASLRTVFEDCEAEDADTWMERLGTNATWPCYLYSAEGTNISTRYAVMFKDGKLAEARELDAETEGAD